MSEDSRHNEQTSLLYGPQLVIIVPTRELGVQTVMLIYKLFGGAVNSQVPGDAANMFTYQGPRGLKVPACRDKPQTRLLHHPADHQACPEPLHTRPILIGMGMAF